MIQNYLTTTAERYASKWLVLAIDLLIVCFSFVLSYFIRFNLTFNFEVEKLLYQVPLVLSVFLIAFLVIGSYKGVVRHTGIKDVYNIFNAICLASVLTIFFVLGNRFFEFLGSFTIPLSIIIINSLLGFMGLVASRYVFKVFYFNILNENRPRAVKNIINLRCHYQPFKKQCQGYWLC